MNVWYGFVVIGYVQRTPKYEVRLRTGAVIFVKVPKSLPSLRSRRRRRFLVGALLVLFALVGYAYTWKWTQRPVRRVFTTQRAGEPPRVWRNLKSVWTFSPGPSGTTWPVTVLLGNDDRLLYLSDCETGCLNADTGKPIWRFPFISHSLAQAGPASNPDRAWTLTRDKDRLYVSEMKGNQQTSVDPFRVCALDARTGKELWEVRYTTPPCGDITVAGALLLLPNIDGTVKALRRQDGKLVWQRRMSANFYPRDNENATLHLGEENGIGIAQIGGAHLRAFRVGDGSTLWEQPRTLKQQKAAEEKNGDDFALDHGVLYTLLNGTDAVALDIPTGRRRWQRHSEDNGSQLAVTPGTQSRILCRFNDTTVALNGKDGTTAWFGDLDGARSLLTETTEPKDPFSSPSAFPTSPLPDKPLLYFQANSDPVIHRAQRPLRSLASMTMLFAVDTRTGQERWRWQPTHDMSFDKIVVGKHRLYVNDGNKVVAVEDGFEEPLPDNPRARALVARRLLSLQYRWPPLDENPLHLWMRRLATPASRWNTLQPQPPESSELELTMLSLGHDCVEMLLDWVRHTIKEQEAKPRPTLAVGWYRDMPDGLTNVLDLLFDLNDPAVAPALAAQLDIATHSGTRKVLAETLVRLGDVRTLRSLWRYVQTPDPQLEAREDALYFACRNSVPPGTPPARVGLPPDAPTRDEVTAWLLRVLTDRKTPDWLRATAKFEMLNDRGDSAQRAALATFHREKTLRPWPADVVLETANQQEQYMTRYTLRSGFPAKISPDATARDGSGRWWAAFTCGYLGTGEHLWFAQSADTRRYKRWHKPVFGVDLGALCTHGGTIATRGGRFRTGIRIIKVKPLTLTCSPGHLRVEWVEVLRDAEGKGKKKKFTQIFRHVQEFAIADLYRDSDGDGIPDRVEKQLGLDPHNPDMNGNGLPDGKDKNPLCRPHPLTDQEALYQAVIDALCQLGRTLPPSTPTSDDANAPTPFGRRMSPLILPAPPGSAGVEIQGHTGPVLCRPLRAKSRAEKNARPTRAFEEPSFRFIAPHIGLDGNWHGHDREGQGKAAKPTDPFVASPDAETAKAAKTDAFAFKTYFPIAISKDGKRARIGFEPGGDGLWGGNLGFDIEVHKVGGRWLPVECRRVYMVGHHAQDTVILPVRNRMDRESVQQSWRSGY